MSHVMRHLNYFVSLFLDKVVELVGAVEGLLSPGHTPSSIYIAMQVASRYGKCYERAERCLCKISKLG